MVVFEFLACDCVIEVRKGETFAPLDSYMPIGIAIYAEFWMLNILALRSEHLPQPQVVDGRESRRRSQTTAI